MKILFMQHYLDHVKHSRRELRNIVEKIRNSKTPGVYIRGTASTTISLESIITPKPEKTSTPFYSGYLKAFDLDTAIILFDSSLRKSISFALEHLTRSGIRIDAQGIEIEKLQGSGLHLVLGILLSAQDITELHVRAMQGGLEFGYIGNEIIPTLLDIRMGKLQMELKLEDGSVKSGIIAALPVDEIIDAISKLSDPQRLHEVEKFSRRKMRRFGRNGLELKQDRQDCDPKLFYPIEGFKKPGNALLYGCAIEIEIAAMNKIIAKLKEMQFD